jgi:hypothetical protein
MLAQEKLLMKQTISRFALALACSLVATHGFAAEDDEDDTETEADKESEEEKDAEDTTENSAEAGTAVAPTEASIDTDTGGKKRRFFIGARLGYGIPMGKIVDAGGVQGEKLSEWVSFQVPLWLDLGFLITPNILVGAYGTFGLVKTSDDFCGDSDCSGNSYRFGVQAQYHISPAESVNPWVGLGFGYEVLNIKREVKEAFGGWEFANIQAGADFKLSDGVGLGPFVSFSLDQYRAYSRDGDAVEIDQLGDKALHQWLTLGVRGAFRL